MSTAANRGCRTLAIVLAILVAGTMSSRAQQREVEFSTYRLFTGDSVDADSSEMRKLADAIRKALPPGGCLLGRLKIRTPEGDPIFQSSLAAARRDHVMAILDRQGIPVAGRLFVESTVFGPVGGHDTVYEAPRDRKAPKLTTASVPRKGSKVKAGDQIKVTMVARDDPEPWPTGLKTIQLVADSEGGRFIASENYEPCAQPAERRVEAMYRVPQNPPRWVRLTALAEDHAGHMDTDTGTFPTVEMWKGAIKLERDTLNPACSAITSEAAYVIEVGDDGEVSGSGTFDHSGYTCKGGFTASATQGTIKMVGKKVGSTFTIYVNDWEPKNSSTPRIPGGPQILEARGSTAEGTFSPGPPGVVFRVKLECQTCGPS